MINPFKTQNAEGDSRQDLVMSLAAFLLTVIAAVIGKWETTDVIWGLWICSLVVGYSYIVIAILSSFFDPEEKSKAALIPAAIFMLAFFTFHFGIFHLVHGVFLNEFFPLNPGAELDFGSRGPLVIGQLAAMAFAKGWPLIIGTYITRWKTLPFRREQKNLKNVFFAPYLNVIRMHILIFVFAGLQAVKLDRYSLIPVLAFYFFPWSAIFSRKKSPTNSG